LVESLALILPVAAVPCTIERSFLLALDEQTFDQGEANCGKASVMATTARHSPDCSISRDAAYHTRHHVLRP
jgi:hypothetical protein